MKTIKSVSLFSIIVLSSLAMLIYACGSSGGNSNSNSNFNGNTNGNSNANFSISSSIAASVVEPAAVGICRVYADKLALFCDVDDADLTDWHVKAFEEKDAFVKLCAADEEFQGADEEKFRAIEEDVNSAANCDAVLESL